jgi:hypothetical protein
MPHRNPYSILFVFIVLVLASILPAAIWKRPSMNKTWKIFERWSKLNGFQLEARNPNFYNPDSPTAFGKIEKKKTEIIVTSKYKDGYWTVIRVFSSINSNLYFSIGVDSFSDDLLKKLNLVHFDSGNDQFDEKFSVKSNDLPVLLGLLDERTVQNFLSNQFLFENNGVSFTDGTLRYARRGLISTDQEMNNAFEIAQFLAELVSRLDKIRRN